MILGIGADLVEITRIESSLRRNGDRLAKRILTPEELQRYFKHVKKAHYLATRFAAKEATVKALGTGFADSITWKQVNIANNEKGMPVLTLTGKARERADALGVSRLHISISDEKHYAVAFVILES